jgi:hypothetical protein
MEERSHTVGLDTGNVSNVLRAGVDRSVAPAVLIPNASRTQFENYMAKKSGLNYWQLMKPKPKSTSSATVLVIRKLY